MASESGANSSGEYIAHHLTNLTFGQHTDGTWGIARSGEEIARMGFWSINLDSIGFSVVLGAVFMALSWAATNKEIKNTVRVNNCFISWVYNPIRIVYKPIRVAHVS